MNFHWQWRLWDPIQAIFLNLFYFTLVKKIYSQKTSFHVVLKSNNNIFYKFFVSMFTSLVFPLLVVPVPNSTLENDCILNLHWKGSKRCGIVDSCCHQTKNIEACCCNSLGFDYYSGLSLHKHPHTVVCQQSCSGFLDSRCSWKIGRFPFESQNTIFQYAHDMIQAVI